MKKQGNIYLIGFMGVGKTTVSKYLRELTGWEEVDTDKVIVRKKNMGIPEIFEKYGENYFRNLESHILEDYAKGAADRILWRWNYFTGKQPEADEKKRHRDFVECDSADHL